VPVLISNSEMARHAKQSGGRGAINKAGGIACKSLQPCQLLQILALSLQRCALLLCK